MLPFPRGPQSPARDKRLLKAVDLARFGWVALGHPQACQAYVSSLEPWRLR